MYRHYLFKFVQSWDLCLWSVMGETNGSTCLVTDSHGSRNRKEEEDCHTKPNYAGSNVHHLPLDTCEQSATNLKQKRIIFRTMSSYPFPLTPSESYKQEFLNCKEKRKSLVTCKVYHLSVVKGYKWDLCKFRNKWQTYSFSSLLNSEVTY